MIDLKLLREDPDRVRASQRARGEDPGARRRAAGRRRRAALRHLGRRQSARRTEGGEQAGRCGRQGSSRRAAGAAGARQGARRSRSRPPRRSRPPPSRRSPRRTWRSRTSSSTASRPAARTTSSCSRPSASPRPSSNPKDHLELGESLGLIDMERGAKVSGSRFYFLTGFGALLQLGLHAAGGAAGDRERLHADDPAGAGAAGGDGGHRFPRCARRRGLPARGRRHVPRRHLGGAAGGLPRRRDPRPLRRAAALRRMVVVLPPRGGQLRQGHPRHHPRAPVRQGRGLRLLQARGRRGRAPAAAGVAARDARPDRGALPRHRHRRRRSRFVGGPQVRLRGVGADAGHLPRADLDVELHDVPGAPARHPLPRRERQAADRGDAQRHAGHHALAGRDPGEPSAARRQRPGARCAGALRREVRAWSLEGRSDTNWITTNCGRGSDSGWQGTSPGTSNRQGRPPTSPASRPRASPPRASSLGTHRVTTVFSASSRCRTTRSNCRRATPRSTCRSSPRSGWPAEVVWQGDTVASLQPFALGAFNDCSIRRPERAEDQPQEELGTGVERRCGGSSSTSPT